MNASRDLPPPPPLRTLSAEGPVALFIDFDGTLVPLADTPDAILVPDDLAGRLLALAERLDGALAVVSGRAVADLERHCGTLAIARAGSHGADRRLAGGAVLGEAPEAMSTGLHDFLRSLALELGFRVEAKPHGSALHYRDNPGAEEATLAAARKIAAEHGLAVKSGKFVVELVRPGADKGGAVRAFMQEAPFAGRRPIFVGDDVTDEDGMRAATELGGFGVLVGDLPSGAARFRLAEPAAVFDWLEL